MCILTTLKKSWRWLIVDTEGGNSNFLFGPASPVVYCQVCSSGAVYNHKSIKLAEKFPALCTLLAAGGTHGSQSSKHRVKFKPNPVCFPTSCFLFGGDTTWYHITQLYLSPPSWKEEFNSRILIFVLRAENMQINSISFLRSVLTHLELQLLFMDGFFHHFD